MALADFQEKFKHMMFQPVKNLQNNANNFDGVFQEDDIAVHDRLKIYHNNVIGSLSSVLCATFPLLENLVGEDFLKAMARTFIFEHPPESACLHVYGAGFDNFIKSYEPAASLPYLPDVATLEFALNTAYYAPDDKPLAADALSKIPPENLGDIILQLRSSAILIESDYPLKQIRAFCLDEGNNIPPDMTKTYQCRLLIHRPALEVDIVPLAEDEFMILGLLNQKNTLGITVEQTLDKFPTFDFAGFLQKHTALETFASFGTNEFPAITEGLKTNV